jgi:hypothetical protein
MTFRQLTRGQKSLAIIVIGVVVILALRFGGWMVIARSLRWILPVVVLYVVWKRIFRK